MYLVKVNLLPLFILLIIIVTSCLARTRNHHHNGKSDKKAVTIDEGFDAYLDCLSSHHRGKDKASIDHFSSSLESSLSSSHEIKTESDGIASTGWTKDGKPINLADQNHYVYHELNGSLIIKRVTAHDEGVYQCFHQTSGSPNGGRLIHLKVKEKLKFIDPQIDKKLELASVSKIYCKTRGYLPPVVTWVKEGSEYLPAHVKQENGTLVFDGVQSTDSGRYTCTANDTISTINATVTVEVVKSPKFVVKPTGQQEVALGSSIALHCSAEGDPQPIIHWDKNNKLNGFSDGDRVISYPNGTLVITDVQSSDEGKYGCIAGNSAGFERTEVTLVIVKSIDRSLPPAADYDEEEKMTRTIIITAGAATLYMLLVLVLMIWCRYRNAKKKAAALMYSQNGSKPDISDLEMKERGRKDKVAPDHQGPEHFTLLPPSSNGEGSLSNLSRNGGPPGASSNLNLIKEEDRGSQASSSRSLKRTKSPYESLQYSRSDLITVMLLGHGEFGDVYLAKATGLRDGEVETLTMVKSLQSREEAIHHEYKREMDMFHKLTSPYIVRLLGICAEAEPFLMILEYTDWGDLKQFLMATRKESKRNGPKPAPLTTGQIIDMSRQVSLGMDHLTCNRFIHKDLATRNILLTSSLKIKITSTSLSKDTYSGDYVNLGNRDLPIRWAPHEAVFEDEWSAKSDVWSFGILVWELLNQAQLPYSDKSDEAIVSLLKKKQLFPQTYDLSSPLDQLIASCCALNPKERPDFGQICKTLETLIDDE